MKKVLLLLTVIFVCSAAHFQQTQAQNYTITHDVYWETHNQNMWGPNGQPFNINIHLPLFHVDYDTNFQVGWMDTVLGVPFGAMFNFDTWFVLGSTFEMYGWTTGWVDVEYPVEMDLTIPNNYTFNPGQIVTLNSDYTVLPGAELTSHFPQAGVISLDLDFGMGLNVDATVCLAGCTTIPVIDVNIPLDSIAIFYLNGQTGQFIYPCIQNGWIAFCHDTILPITFNNLWGIGLSGWITLPYIETVDYLDTSDPCHQMLIANGDSTYMFLELDIVQFLSAIAGLIPPPQGPAIQQFLGMLSGTLDMGGGIYIEYNLFSAWLDISNTMQQDLTFNPTVQTILTFPTPVEYFVTNPHNGNQMVDQGVDDIIAFPTCCDFHYRYPCYGWPQLEIGYGAHLANDFTNHVWDSLAFTFVITALEFTITLPFPFMKSYTIPETCIQTHDVNGNPVKICLPEITNEEFYPELPNSQETVSTSDTLETDTLSASKNGTKYTWHFGPLIDLSLPLGYIPITWYNNTWELAGFIDTTFAPFIMIPNPEFELVSIIGTDNICNGDSIGTITVEVQYGTPPYIYTWSHGVVDTSASTINTQTGLTSGTYYITVSDINGCSHTGSYTLIDVNPPIFINLTPQHVLCHGQSTGAIFSNVTGGTPGYTYTWSPVGGNGPNATSLPAGWYTLSVVDQAGCPQEASIEITEPATYVSVVLDSLEHVHCFGGSNGYIGIHPIGGTPGYTYNWSNFTSAQNAANLSANTYTVTVTDNNGCTITFTETVTQPPLLTATVLATNVTCYGFGDGTIDLTVNGGTPPYSYIWTNGATTQDLDSLQPGGYQVTVSDSYNCTATAGATITQPYAPLSATGVITHVLCHGDFTGAINVTVDGGTPPYSYAWTSGQTTQDLNSIPADLYGLNITDFNGCTFFISFVVTQPPAPLTLSISSTDVRCFGENNGSIDLTAGGGTHPYSYHWNNGSADQDLSQLPAGYYQVTVTDAHNCTAVIGVFISEPAAVHIDVTPPQYICIGQSATIICSATGGTPWYNYFWSNNAPDSIQTVSPTQTTTYTIYVTDTRGCISPVRSTTVYVYPPITADVYAMNPEICAGEPAILLSNSTGGNGNLIYTIDSMWIPIPYYFYPHNDTVFTVTVSDNCGTPPAQSFISITIKPSPPVSFVPDITEGCAPLTVNFIEGSPDMGQTYLWNFGDPNSANTSTSRNPEHTFANAGIYTVSLTVTAANGCKTTQTLQNLITVYAIPIAAFVAEPNAVNVVKPLVHFINLSQYADVYFWYFGDGDSAQAVSPYHTYPPVPFDYLATLIARNAFGCSDTVSAKIMVKGDYTFYAPTAFSPDEDGRNEFFVVRGTNIDNANFKMIIYDRWGEKVFETSDMHKGWDGRIKEYRKATLGTYTWIAIFKDKNGVLHEEAGTVTLIR